MKNFFRWVLGIFVTALISFLLFLYEKVLIPRVSASISGSILDKIVSFAGWPFQTWAAKSPMTSATEWEKWMYIISTALLEVLFLFGSAVLIVGVGYWIYSSYTKRTLSLSPPELLAQRELAIAIATVDASHPTDKVAQRAVDEMIDTFNKGVGTLFSLKPHEYRTYWLVAVPHGYEAYSKNSPLSQQDKHAIKSALQHPDDRVYDDDLTGKRYNEAYDGKHVFFVRNEGSFKLAFVVFILKDKAVHKQNRKDFERAVSSMMLLGHVDVICNTMLELTKVAQEVQ